MQLMATKKNTQFVNLEWRDSTWCNKNTKPASLTLVLFALGCFHIKTVQDLGEFNKYRYFRIKKPYKYKYSNIEKPHKYRYFRTEEPYKYRYLIVKKLDRDI